MATKRKYQCDPSPTDDWEERPESVQATSVSRLPDDKRVSVEAALYGEPDDDRLEARRWQV